MKGVGDAWLCLDVVGCASYADGYAQVSARYPGGSMTRAVGRKNRQTLQLRASVHDLCVIPIAFESQGILHKNWEEIYHLFARHWVQTYRAEVDESHQGRAWWISYVRVSLSWRLWRVAYSSGSPSRTIP